ncbi:YopX family protein [Leuconostoc falkenbergense]|uniref:YopX family protein n=1 Tax=Leuconostoc falkenbergense TaxID=2766470 RepID=UPI0021AAE9E7|nr:YopX family protein [Leuconostoc falkenbergense]
MREIKFRAWNGVLHKYRTIDMNSGKQNLGMGFEATEGIGSNTTTIYHSVGDVIEQYSGLKDKNGVDIYENDIVMWRDGESIRYAQVAFAPDIKFLTRDYVFNYGRFAYKDTEKHLTVIGNIHENVDLLEEQS